MEICFRIGSISIKISSDDPVQMIEAFREFVTDDSECDWQVQIKKKQKLKEISGKEIYSNPDYLVFEHNQRVYVDRLDDNRPYCISALNENDRTVTIEYLAEKKQYLNEMGNVFFHLGWEKMFSLDGVFPFHASCIDSPFSGILFSGPSGIGKSTQADLWCRNTESTLLNGDRPLIGRDRKNGSRWLAWGSPYAGSSRCHKYASCEIRTIVMLQQAKECSLRKLSANEAFHLIYHQMIACIWDRDYMERLLQMIMELVEQIPIYELACTPDRNALNLLWGELERNQIIEENR